MIDLQELRSIETHQELLYAIEQILDDAMGTQGFGDDYEINDNIREEITEGVFRLLYNRDRTTLCGECDNRFVTRLNPDGCPYCDHSCHQHDDEDEEDDDDDDE